jgi:hypothetical protein
MDKQENITYHGGRLYGTKPDNKDDLGIILPSPCREVMGIAPPS